MDTNPEGDLTPGAAARWQQWWAQRDRAAPNTTEHNAARTQGFVLDCAELRSLGWLEHEVRREIRRGTWWAPARSVVAVLAVPHEDDDPYLSRRRRHALCSTSAALVHCGSTISARSAALVHGLPTLAVPKMPELTSPIGRTTGRHARALVRCNSLPPEHVTTWYGAPVTTIARTIVDLARLDRRDGLIAADAALHERLVSRAEIDAVLRAAAGQRGVRQARAVLALASAKAESPLESLVRLKMHDDGFPDPALQVVVSDPFRRRTYRLDMLVEAAALVLEIDGLSKYDASELKREKLREARLRALGYRVERVVWEDVMRYWPQTRARLRAALAITPGPVEFRADSCRGRGQSRKEANGRQPNRPEM